ncbi:hypothetical protein AYY16_00525 [Morganella psychrotolerans]|nr:hypothetical protein AYY16_00525 [Morganella psychrotolerans]
MKYYEFLTKSNDNLRANGSTNKTVGNATIHDNPHDVSHGETKIHEKPRALIVLIRETIPLITRDKKNGTKKNQGALRKFRNT